MPTAMSPISWFESGLQLALSRGEDPLGYVTDNLERINKHSLSQRALLAFLLLKQAPSLSIIDVKETFGFAEKHNFKHRVLQMECITSKGDPSILRALEEDRISTKSAHALLDLPVEQQQQIANKSYKDKNGQYRTDAVAKSLSLAVKVAQKDVSEGGIGVGSIRGHQAVDILKRIPKNDPLRQRGFQIVKDFIKHNP